MKDIGELLAVHWNLRDPAITAVGPVWKVTAETGTYCLKPGKHGRKRLRFDHEAIEALYRNGYAGTPRFHPTSAGAPFAETRDGLFALTDWVGRTLNVASLPEWNLAAAELACFHQAAENLPLATDSPRVFFAGRWLRRYPERTEHLQVLFDSLDPADPLQAEMREAADDVLERARAATAALQNSAYSSLAEQVQVRPTLVHGNVKGENFTVNDKGKIFLIDFDSFRLDVSVQDLSDLYAAFLPAVNWSLPAAQELFESYHAARPVSAEEAEVLLALLAYPTALYKAVHKYKNEGRTPDKARRKWRLAYREFEQENEFFVTWASWLRNRVQ